MFITEIRIENMAKAIAIAKDKLEDEIKAILGIDTTDHVCEYVVSWYGGNGGYKQARVNTVTGEWTVLTEPHITEEVM